MKYTYIVHNFHNIYSYPTRLTDFIFTLFAINLDDNEGNIITLQWGDAINLHCLTH